MLTTAATPYTINAHRHRFAAWCGGTAAIRSRTSGFNVKVCRDLLEETGMEHLLECPDCLPTPDAIDAEHRKWRNKLIEAANIRGLRLTHGVTAKLINVYLKAGYVCGGHHEHEKVKSLHPPIDSLLLKELRDRNVGNQRRVWSSAAKSAWSNFDSEQYEMVIRTLRRVFNDVPLWTVEEYWSGYQNS